MHAVCLAGNFMVTTSFRRLPRNGSAHDAWKNHNLLFLHFSLQMKQTKYNISISGGLVEVEGRFVPLDR